MNEYLEDIVNRIAEQITSLLNQNGQLRFNYNV